MNKFNFVRNNNGVIKLPPGFRFQPTDEELVFQYLRRKIFSCPLPSSSDIIPEINLCKYDPWDLPHSGHDLEQDRYFFSHKESKYRSGSSRANRKTGSGYWKATGSDKKIMSSAMKHVVGTRKTLVFYRGKPPQGSRTDWFMHEYSLHVNNVVDQANISTTQEVSQNQTENWILCRIFLKERSANKINNINSDENIEQNWEGNNVGKFGTNYQPRMFDLVTGCEINTGPALSSSSLSSSSSSSSATEVSSSYTCHEESNGYGNF
uniref:NAC domain-containing protein n=1 Tax=Boehmeria nivea TaxID=83906 RepID=A0A060A657_BOENI|nr:NAC domain-containing protein [Boehmeria nivea]